MRMKKIEYAKQFLERDGPLSTREIYDLFLDEHPKKCPTMYELASILGKCPAIIKHNLATNERTSRAAGSLSHWIGHTVWKMKEEVV